MELDVLDTSVSSGKFAWLAGWVFDLIAGLLRVCLVGFSCEFCGFFTWVISLSALLYCACTDFVVLVLFAVRVGFYCLRLILFSLRLRAYVGFAPVDCGWRLVVCFSLCLVGLVGGLLSGVSGWVVVISLLIASFDIGLVMLFDLLRGWFRCGLRLVVWLGCLARGCLVGGLVHGGLALCGLLWCDALCVFGFLLGGLILIQSFDCFRYYFDFICGLVMFGFLGWEFGFVAG